MADRGGARRAGALPPGRRHHACRPRLRAMLAAAVEAGAVAPRPPPRHGDRARTAASVRITTDGDEIVARACVVAAGAWARGLLAGAGIELAVIPTRETVTYFRLPGAARAAARDRRRRARPGRARPATAGPDQLRARGARASASRRGCTTPARRPIPTSPGVPIPPSCAGSAAGRLAATRSSTPSRSPRRRASTRTRPTSRSSSSATGRIVVGVRLLGARLQVRADPRADARRPRARRGRLSIGASLRRPSRQAQCAAMPPVPKPPGDTKRPQAACCSSPSSVAACRRRGADRRQHRAHGGSESDLAATGPTTARERTPAALALIAGIPQNGTILGKPTAHGAHAAVRGPPVPDLQASTPTTRSRRSSTSTSSPGGSSSTSAASRSSAPTPRRRCGSPSPPASRTSSGTSSGCSTRTRARRTRAG